MNQVSKSLETPTIKAKCSLILLVVCHVLYVAAVRGILAGGRRDLRFSEESREANDGAAGCMIYDRYPFCSKTRIRGAIDCRGAYLEQVVGSYSKLPDENRMVVT